MDGTLASRDRKQIGGWIVPSPTGGIPSLLLVRRHVWSMYTLIPSSWRQLFPSIVLYESSRGLSYILWLRMCNLATRTEFNDQVNEELSEPCCDEHDVQAQFPIAYVIINDSHITIGGCLRTQWLYVCVCVYPETVNADTREFPLNRLWKRSCTYQWEQVLFTHKLINKTIITNIYLNVWMDKRLPEICEN